MNKKIFIPFLCVLCMFGLGGCNKSNKGMMVATIDGFTQGTYYHIVYISKDTLILNEQIDSLLTVIDNSMSIFNPNSLISQINRNETARLDDYIAYCINTARSVSEASDGMYDITVMPLVEAWGFGTKDKEEHPNLDSLLQFVGFKKIFIKDGCLIKSDPRVMLNLNSIAKGYSADIIARFIESRGVKSYLVEIGGEIVAKGNNPSGTPWIIGVDRPIDGNYVPGADTQIKFALNNKSMATSGNYRNFRYDENGRKIVHTINPKTGASTPSNLLSATVVTDNCAKADAYATALMAMGTQQSIKVLESDHTLWGYLIYVNENGEMESYISPELKKEIK